jgi:hypothetical protein
MTGLRQDSRELFVMNEYEPPEEVHTLIEFRQRNLPGFATVNGALKEFEPKAVFSWQLSVLIAYDDKVADQLPSADEQGLLHSFEDRLDLLLKQNSDVLFVARVTHDGRREIVWRTRNPEVADSVLRDMLREKSYPREFDYRIDHDPAWEKAKWYLQNA